MKKIGLHLPWPSSLQEIQFDKSQGKKLIYFSERFQNDPINSHSKTHTAN